MKKIFYNLFRRSVTRRAENIHAIRSERRQRIINAIQYLNEWHDIPLTFMFTAVCDRLKIAPTEAAKDFIIQLSYGNPDVEQFAKRLP